MALLDMIKKLFGGGTKEEAPTETTPAQEEVMEMPTEESNETEEATSSEVSTEDLK